MTRRGTSAGTTLLLDDALKKIVYKDGSKSFKREKADGHIPKGLHSCFGDYPPDYSPKNPFAMYRSSSSPALSRSGLSRSGNLFMNSKDAIMTGTWRGEFGHPIGPFRAGSTKRRPVVSSEFRRFYDRGDLPVQIMHGQIVGGESDTKGKHYMQGGNIIWKAKIDDLDYHHYLPIFFDGLREKEDPYRYLAVEGAYDMLERGGPKILPVIPQLIIPIKTALNTRDPDIIATVLKVLQRLVTSGKMIGEALVPYYRQILPIFNVFKNKNTNIGDGIEYSQRKRLNLGDLISETLEVLEIHGGEDAFINIKYMIPVYESCIAA